MLIYSIAVLFLALQNSSGLKIYSSNVTKCVKQGNMGHGIRRTFLEEYNEKRASLAEGKVQNFPEAADMRFMAYDCKLENEAMKLTKDCLRFKTQSIENRINVASFDYEGNGVITVAKKAVSEWWNKKPEGKNGVPEVPQISNDSAMPFFLIAQAEADKVGCSVNVCGPFSYYTVACVYENEAKVGRNLYEKGTACTNCTGHCYEKLCNATTSVL